MTQVTTVRMFSRSLRLACIIALLTGIIGVGALTAAEIGANDFQISSMGAVDTGPTNAIGNFTSAVAYNSTTNEYLVVWAGDDISPGGDGDFEIFGQRLNATTGAKIGAAIPLSNTGAGNPGRDANNPAVAYNATANQFLVVWSADEIADGKKEIYGKRVSATGTVLDTSTVRLSTMGNNTPIFDALTPAVACQTTTSACLVVWSGNETVDNSDVNNPNDPIYEIYGQLVTTGALLTEIGTDDFRISDMGTSDTSGLYDALTPAVAYNSATGEYLVVWSGDDNSAPLVEDEFEIFGQRINATTGAQVGTNDFRISDMGPDGNPGYDALTPAVAYNSATGEYLVVWSGDDTTPGAGQKEIFGQRVSAAGAAVGINDFRISDMGPDTGPTAANFDAYNPAVTYNSSTNEYLAAWSGDDTTDDEFEIFGQRISAAGAEVGANDFRISDMGPNGDANFDALVPAVAYNTTNRESLVVWIGDDNTGGRVNDQYEVFGQRLELNPPRVTKVNSVADTGDGNLAEGESTNAAITQLLITFSEAVSNTETIPNYLLVNNGGNNTFQTSACGAAQGDDTAILINSANYSSATNTVTLTVNGGLPLPNDGYRLFACAANLTDADGNALDGNGDGTAGDDFIRNFSVVAAGLIADLAISKAESQDPIVLGSGNLIYTLTVVNHGPGTSSAVVLTDTLPTGVTVASVNPSTGVTCATPTGLVRCQLGNMTAVTTATVTIAVTPSAAGTLTNTATVASASTTDPIAANNTATITTTVSPAAANLSVVASGGPGQVAVGSTQAYTFTVTNGGPDGATAVQFNAAVPAGMTLVSATSSVGSCTANTGTGQVTCSLGNLASGATATVRVTVRATQVGAKSLVANVSSTTPDPIASNNSATQSVTVTQAKLYLPLVRR
jgi:uncharacterized repeat protein (TIGR01451 family)